MRYVDTVIIWKENKVELYWIIALKFPDKSLFLMVLEVLKCIKSTIKLWNEIFKIQFFWIGGTTNKLERIAFK